MTVEPTPSVRPGRPTRSAIRAVALAAVAAITITACSSGDDDDAGTQDPTEPTTSQATDVTSEPGRVSGNVGDVPISYIPADGWGDIGWAAIKGDPIYGLVFMEVGNTYDDSCPSVARDPAIGPTVDDLGSAWADLPGMNATTPTDITVDGFAGQEVEFTVPDYPTGATVDECADGGHFMLLEGADTPGDGYWAQGPNQHHQLRIVDVDGTRVVIGATWFPDTSEEDRADIDEMLSSIQIG